ncbi:A24 family peptidase [Cupriavidus pauculus]|uniref:prepilin peptidase n=1 Tax=Cupriavidus pauculus TaxID=82633 RepID=UPI001EE210B9|nr:A24 family peptidase [Cupriavidus pauculus]GJG97438.1 prepilin peptidase [Cupriavidus pauculus]
MQAVFGPVGAVTLDSLAALPAPFLIVVAGLVGLLVGSFLNVVIHRLPKMMDYDEANYIAEVRGEPLPHPDRYNLMVPRSACPHCGHQIAAWENVPIVSYLFLRGKCSSCKAPISARYPLVEAVTGVLTALAMWHFGPTVQALAAIALIWSLVALFMIDADTQLLPDQITLPLLWLGLLLNLQGYFAPLAEAVIGAAAGYLVLWMVYWIFKLVRGREGMGYGDFKLMGALGAWFGWQALPALILMSSIVGAVIGGAMLLIQRKGSETTFPFGPYIAGAGLIVLFFGPDVLPLGLTPGH